MANNIYMEEIGGGDIYESEITSEGPGALYANTDENGGMVMNNSHVTITVPSSRDPTLTKRCWCFYLYILRVNLYHLNLARELSNAHPTGLGYKSEKKEKSIVRHNYDPNNSNRCKCCQSSCMKRRTIIIALTVFMACAAGAFLSAFLVVYLKDPNMNITPTDGTTTITTTSFQVTVRY